MKWYERMQLRQKNRETMRQKREDEKHYQYDREDVAEAFRCLSEIKMTDDEVCELAELLKDRTLPTYISNVLADYINEKSKQQTDTEKKVELEELRDYQIKLTNRLKSFWKLGGEKE